jgi:general secretion pathway protein J
MNSDIRTVVDGSPIRQLGQLPLNCRQGGLTLIELCVAVALIAVITTMSYRGLDSLNRVSERTLADSQRWQSAALFFERFAGDVAQPARRPVRDPGNPGETNMASGIPSAFAIASLTSQSRLAMATAGMQPSAEVSALPAWWGRSVPAGSPDSQNQNAVSNFDCLLEFTRKSITGRDEIRLGYRLRDSRVELLIWPVLDRAPASVPEIYTLLDGVGSLRFRHLDANGAWQDAWPLPGNSDMHPRAVEVEVIYSDGLVLHRIFALPS